MVSMIHRREMPTVMNIDVVIYARRSARRCGVYNYCSALQSPRGECIAKYGFHSAREKEILLIYSRYQLALGAGAIHQGEWRLQSEWCSKRRRRGMITSRLKRLDDGSAANGGSLAQSVANSHLNFPRMPNNMN